ncbi:TnsD family Tn7-like transposition protein [Cohnella lubricantis]|uniref:TniQ family protein n=1 Tax=Cohnella lubricantis TaxID=2163172 RepID=A0A841TAW7_9BACL|nr:TnsD family Tn7-like transposition protein [Cohnella lubricantis]MBB6678142.1 TniQ family protein [Cohnella lubricantis]MBP2120646.1 transposase-like protein [Cohnella lubricantis]
MSQMIFFPEPLPDEDFRSIVCRYHLMSSNSIFSETKEELFGIRSHKNLMFPMKLEYFCCRLPIGHSLRLNTFIEKHTWVGLIFCFLTKTNQEKIHMLMKFGNEKLYQTTLLHIAGLFSKQIRYCPECLKVDEEQFGICYVHRIHQLSFLDHCPVHYTKLINACPNCNHPLSKDYAEELIYQSKCKKCKSTIGALLIDKKNSLTMFKDKLLQDLCKLRDCSEKLSAEIIQLKLMMKLWELKYIHYRGRIMKLEFLTEMASKYSLEQLEAIGLEKAELVTKYFVSRFLTLDHLRTHILFYTVLIQNLFHSVDEFLSYSHPIANQVPFGIGPWECYNTICKGYNRKVINRCIRKSKGSGGSTISVEFVCPLCGYTYSRLWQPEGDESRKPLVVSMGHIWQEKVMALYCAGYSIYQIRNETGFSESALKTYVNQLKYQMEKVSELKIPLDTSLAISETATIGVLENKDIFRNILSDTAREKKTRKRLMMLRLHPREYNWLYRHDSDWLNKHFPRQPSVKGKIDLKDFDIKLAKKIREVTNQLETTCNTRIRKHTILNQLTPLEKSRITSMQERLPESARVLNQSIEDLESFLIRGLSRIFKKLRMKGYRTVTFGAVVSYSKQYGRCGDETRTRIEMILDQLNREF